MAVTKPQAIKCMKYVSKQQKEIEALISEKVKTHHPKLQKLKNVKSYEEYLTNRIEELYKIKHHVLNAISKIDNVNYRILLERYYLSKWSLVKLTHELHYSERNIWYIHQHAITELATHLDENIINKI